MYSQEHLKFLKQKYMEQDYPKDLNDHVMNCIARGYVEKINKKRVFNIQNNFFIRFAFLAVSFVFITSLYSKRFKLYDEQLNIKSKSHIPNVSSYIYKNDVKETEYDIYENELMISIYPISSNYSIEDNFYNIDKELGNIVTLKDILIDDLSSITDMEDKFKNAILNENSKFFINKNGNYIIVTYDINDNVFLINLNHDLERKVLKSRYIFK